jgi:hypothetical protein
MAPPKSSYALAPKHVLVKNATVKPDRRAIVADVVKFTLANIAYYGVDFRRYPRVIGAHDHLARNDIRN